MSNEGKTISSMKLELKEIVAVISLTVSVVVGYFTIIKDFETRLVRLETRFEELKNRSSNNSTNDSINQTSLK